MKRNTSQPVPLASQNQHRRPLRTFKAIKGAQGGDLHASAQAAKYLSRFGILVYLTARFLITQTKRNNSMGDGADASNLPPLMFN